MLSYIGGFVFLAALLHASWNAMLHGNDDRVLSMTWMSIAIAAVSTVVILFTLWPASAAWLYIVVSGLVHIVYKVTLVRSYPRNDLAQAHPIARGCAGRADDRRDAWARGAVDTGTGRANGNRLIARRSSLVGGLVSIAAYGIVIWALQSGTMGAVSALHETSALLRC